MKQRLIRWGIPTATVVLLVVIASIMLAHWMSGSSDGTVTIGTPVAQTKHTSTTPPSEPVTITNAYYTTTLPGGFTIKRQEDLHNAGPIASQLFANTAIDADQQVGITIGTLPSDGLSSIADYHLRITDAATYTQFTPANLPVGGVAFRTVQGPATVTVFWPHGTQYAELAFSTDGKAPTDALLATYNHVRESWQWK